MTMLQRLARALRPRPSGDTPFERYYSGILRNGDGAEGLPSAREAQRDWNELRERGMPYRYL